MTDNLRDRIAAVLDNKYDIIGTGAQHYRAADAVIRELGVVSSAIEDNCPLCSSEPDHPYQDTVDRLREQAHDMLRRAYELQQQINANSRPAEPVVEPGEVVTVTFVRNLMTKVGSRQATFVAVGWMDDHGDTCWSISGSTDPGQSQSWEQLLGFMGRLAWPTITPLLRPSAVPVGPLVKIEGKPMARLDTATDTVVWRNTAKGQAAVLAGRW